MKNIYIGIILFFVLFSTCKKESKQTAPPTGKLQKVTFVVNSFAQQHLGFQTNNVKTKALSSLITNAVTDTQATYPVLFYQVYDATGALVHQIYQDTTTTNFGTINDQLAAGTYTIVMIGGENDEGTGNARLAIGDVVPGEIGYFVMNQEGSTCFFNETFYKKFSLTVTTGAIAQNITLTHSVGKLIIDIQDAIPANVTDIYVSIDSLATAFNLVTGLPDLTTAQIGSEMFTKTQGNFTSGETNYTISNYISNTVTPLTVTISAYSNPEGQQTLVADKIISGVTCGANQQTTLTGNLFGGTTGNGISGGTTLQADTAWNHTVLTYHF